VEIDLFTFAAQVVNFLILVLLLKRFLFDRVAAVMDERAKRTNEALAAAETARKKAEAEASSARALRAEIEADRDRILSEARELAAARLRVAFEEARASGEEERRAWRADLAARKEGFYASLGEGTVAWLGELARKALVDLADEDLESRVVKVFVARFEALDDEAIRNMRSSMESDDSKITITSSFAMRDGDQVEIGELARRRLSWTGVIDYQVDSGEGVGLALVAGGFKVAWRVSEYLRDVDARIRAAFESATGNEEAGHG